MKSYSISASPGDYNLYYEVQHYLKWTSRGMNFLQDEIKVLPKVCVLKYITVYLMYQFIDQKKLVQSASPVQCIIIVQVSIVLAALYTMHK